MVLDADSHSLFLHKLAKNNVIPVLLCEESCIKTQNALIRTPPCMFQRSFHLKPTTEKMPLKYLSASVTTCLCPSCILKLFCTNPQSNFSHSGVTATCECHQHQFTHGQCTLASTGYFLCILELFPTSWPWNLSLRGGALLFLSTSLLYYWPHLDLDIDTLNYKFSLWIWH